MTINLIVDENANSKKIRPDVLGDELDSVVLETISSILLCMAILYSALAISHFFVLTPEQSAVMIPVACTSVLAAMCIYFVLRKNLVTLRFSYLVATMTYSLAMLNSAAQMWVMQDIDQSTNFSLLFIGVGLFFLAKRYVALTYFVTFCVWGAIAFNIEDPEGERMHFLFMIVMSMLLGLLAHSLRLRSMIRLIQMRSEAQVREGELAVALGKARLYAAAEKENKAKTEFLTNMSHELRTPLNAILGFSEMMKAQVFGAHTSPKYVEYSDHIHTAGDHLLSLVNDILDLSRIQLNEESMTIRPVELDRVCRNCITIVRQHAERRHIKLTFDIPDDIPIIDTDERRLKQILTNLLNNAVKFTLPGGKIHLDMTATNDGRVGIRVSDTGIGMSQQELTSATKPFWQAQTGLDRTFEGSGLGLALVIEMLGLLKGELVLESEKGVGTTAIVYLPIGVYLPTPSNAVGESSSAA